MLIHLLACTFGRFTNLTWDWVACTLNPWFEGSSVEAIIDDDGFISETLEHWFFGEDNTGDMRLPHNITATWERAKQMGQILLVTADGSIDSSCSPAEQEEQNAQLHYCECVAAVGALAVGGAFVLKMYTLFEHSSIALVYLLSCLFEETSICKPTMSTPGNSETYIGKLS
jgi:cap2 methyltransferase